MLINQPNFRIAMTAISLAMVTFLYGQLSGKSAAVSGCRARLVQLELIAAQAVKRDTDLDTREKVLDAAEAAINSVKH